MANNPLCVMTCVECEHRQRERRSVVERRCRPRCAMCGGPLYLSAAALKDLVGGLDRAREHPDQKTNIMRPRQ